MSRQPSAGFWQPPSLIYTIFDGALSGCCAAASEWREMMMLMQVEKLCVFFPCSGQQMGAVCFILALLLYDESSRIQPLNTQQMGHFPSSTQLSLSSQTTYRGVDECRHVF